MVIIYSSWPIYDDTLKVIIDQNQYLEFSIVANLIIKYKKFEREVREQPYTEQSLMSKVLTDCRINVFMYSI